MGAQTRWRRGVALGLAAMMAIPAAAQARDVFATDADGNLLRVDTRFPGVILDEAPISGLPAGVSLVGIDIRSTTGQLVGAGNNSVVYSIDPSTAVDSPIGQGFSPGLSGTAFGVDVNPVPDALRVTGDGGLNYRLAFASGNHGAGSPDGALNPGTPRIVASAYTNAGISATRPTSTTLFGIDHASDTLQIQDPPNAGTLGQPRPLGVDVGERTGFDIADGIGYMSANPGGASGTVLYRVDLNSGAATALGPIGTGSLVARSDRPSRTITGIAVRQAVVGPSAVNVPPQVTVVATTPSPRPGQRAAYIAQATDPDGWITKVEWDTDGDGRYDLESGASQRIPLAAGTHTVRVRATDNHGARTVGHLRVRVAR